MPQNPAHGGRGRNDPSTKGVAPPVMRTATNKPLWKHVGELATSSALLLYLSQVATDRLSLTQATFFLLAATADAAGRPATRTELIEAHLSGGRASIRNSYRQLLEPSRVYPTALGWLRTEENRCSLACHGSSLIHGSELGHSFKKGRATSHLACRPPCPSHEARRT